MDRVSSRIFARYRRLSTYHPDMGDTGEGAERDPVPNVPRRPWWAVLLDLVMPVECAGCGMTAEDLGAAGTAGRRGTLISGGLCGRCADAVSGPPFAAARTGRPAGLPPVYALAAYRDPVPDIVVAQKERGRIDLPRPLGRRLARAVLAAAETETETERGRGYRTAPDPERNAGFSLWLVPVPSAKRAVRSRGGDPVRAIARACASELRRLGVLANLLPALTHSRAVSDQAGLSRVERARNLAGALRIRSGAVARLAERPAVLVDDVLTSGATLAEAGRAIRAAGGRPLAAAVVGATAPRR
jgi:predicted amidophosphoribosyltransferase